MASTIEELNFYILYSLMWLVDTVLNSTILEYFSNLDNFF